MFGMPGGTELFFILLIVLVLFGGAKLPSLMRNLGRSAKEFKAGMSDSVEDDTTSEKPAETGTEKVS